MAAADSWYHEKESAWLSEAVAAVEPDPRRLRPIPTAMKLRYEHQIALTREELGLNPDDLASPVRAASSSFGCFAMGGAGLAAWSIGRLPGVS